VRCSGRDWDRNRGLPGGVHPCGETPKSGTGWPAHFRVPELPGTIERAGVDGCVIVVEPGKRKRALLGSNPPRNSRPETHRDKADADESCSSALLLLP
jgi:hypothetical protein